MGWVNAWNTIIRKLIWPDEELKTLMKLPAKTNIIQFVDRYFIRASFTNNLLTDEVCRIVYSDSPGYETDVPNVKRNLMIFDVYELLSFISKIMTLNSGDIIATGTPKGVGPLSIGDTVEITIEDIGTLKNSI